MAKASLKRIRYKSIPKRIPCPDSKPSALTVYIIIRRRMAMDSLEGMRDQSIPFQQQFLVLIHSHLINGIEVHLPPILSTEEGWQWKASNE